MTKELIQNTAQSLFDKFELEALTPDEQEQLEQQLYSASDELFQPEYYAQALDFVEAQISAIRFNEAMLEKNKAIVKAAQSRKKGFEKETEMRRSLLHHALTQMSDAEMIPGKIKGPDYLVSLKNHTSVEYGEELVDYIEAVSALLEELSSAILVKILEGKGSTIFRKEMNLRFVDHIQAVEATQNELGIPKDYWRFLRPSIGLSLDKTLLKTEAKNEESPWAKFVRFATHKILNLTK
jgi:hypothetical protein